MIKKTHRRPLREYRLPRAEKPKEESGANFKEILTILAGGAGVFAAIFWLGGRFFASGYFDSIGIPLHMLTFPIGEYGEQYFGSLFTLMAVIGIFFIKNFFYLLLFAIAILAIAILITLGAKLIKSRLEKERKQISAKPLERAWPIAANIVIVLVLLLLTFIFSLQNGIRLGRELVLGRSNAVTLYAKEPIGEITSLGTEIDGLTIYKYSDLRLLTKNSGKYYLYDDVNPNTCKPTNIYIVDEEKITSTVLTPGNPFDIPSCPSVDVFTYFGNMIDLNLLNLTP